MRARRQVVRRARRWCSRPSTASSDCLTVAPAAWRCSHTRACRFALRPVVGRTWQARTGRRYAASGAQQQSRTLAVSFVAFRERLEHEKSVEAPVDTLYLRFCEERLSRGGRVQLRAPASLSPGRIKRTAPTLCTRRRAKGGEVRRRGPCPGLQMNTLVACDLAESGVEGKLVCWVVEKRVVRT